MRSKMVPLKLQPAAVLLLFLNCWCTDTSETFWVSSSRNCCTVFIFRAVTFISVEMKQSVSASQLLRCRQHIFAQLLWHLEWECCSLGLTPDRSLNLFFYCHGCSTKLSGQFRDWVLWQVNGLAVDWLLRWNSLSQQGILCQQHVAVMSW